MEEQKDDQWQDFKVNEHVIYIQKIIFAVRLHEKQ